MLQEQPPVSSPLHLQPGDTHHYRGFEIYLSDVSRRLVCSYFVTGLRRYCRDIAHGEELIDTWHAAQAQPREPGSMRVLAADVRVTNSMSAHESRRRVEQARGQRRKGGRFAKETPITPTTQPELSPTPQATATWRPAPHPDMPLEENVAAFEAAYDRLTGLHAQEVQARERGDWAACERLYAEQGTETRYMAALTALAPETDWLVAQ
ncbi:hypothetical protein [Deinococcus gobiensis]|uniref:Uncharacterized protein n=1 Tax=Deinococcus gobiensis (strain DSM 21396 / JCM 16679 / CGMCC 1.7299 / I-0) TaxID=745776 RepID=H8H2L2_DEIGI|nr:hypothetical protein [Deinococcus gobiensis]AFD27759.1 hypothetical protein DGo_PB0490 [Deinococcus gobiensis I-0]